VTEIISPSEAQDTYTVAAHARPRNHSSISRTMCDMINAGVQTGKGVRKRCTMWN